MPPIGHMVWIGFRKMDGPTSNSDRHKPYIARNYSHWATSLSLTV